MNEVASFHIATFPRRRLASRLISVPAERWEITQADGCRLGKVMGTSKANTTRVSADLKRWAIFAIWEDEAARKRFVESSSVLKRWRKTSNCLSHYFLQPLSSKGSWNGVELSSESTKPDGPVAVLTHANVRPNKWWTFARSIRPIDDVLNADAECTLALGIGEWPIGEQATFSIWNSIEAIDQFAYRNDAHAEVIRRTFKENWYSEMLFARFALTDSPKR